jgi:microcystin degradation protein MlrC
MSPARPLRVFVGSLQHETNTFSPLPTTRRSYEELVLHQGGDERTLAAAKAVPGYGDMLAVCADAGDEAIAGMCALAQPAGPLAQREYERLRDELLDEVRRAGPLDFIVVVLHGAMVSSDCWDCEGDLLNRLRAIAGATPVGVLLDLHCNLTQAMIDSGALLVACKEYPHTDYRERAKELHSILGQVARGERAMPQAVMRPVPMLALMGTTEGPMKDFVAKMQAHEKATGIVSVSAMHGFPWSDTPHSRAAILVWSDGRHPAAADCARFVANELAHTLFAIGTSAPVKRLPLEAAVPHALALCGRSGPGPVVLADGADNPGGGAACDSTFVLAALLRHGVQDAALGMIWDPQAASIAADAGVGARLPLRVGGKVGPLSGDPLDLDAEVTAVRRDATQAGLSGGAEPLGLAVAVRAAGIDIVINSIRQQVFSPECFTQLGIDPVSKALVVVKSTQHFRMGFDAIASAVVYCDAPGSLNLNLARLPFRHLARPIWPLDLVDTIDAAAHGR